MTSASDKSTIDIDVNKIAYCKIFPPIGIARVGNSIGDDSYYIAPEFSKDLDQFYEELNFKDSKGRIKKQAVRYRVFGFDSSDNVICEFTSGAEIKKHEISAEMRWTVQLANKKASWLKFLGAEKALDAFEGKLKPESLSLRNEMIKGECEFELDCAAPLGQRYKISKKRSDELDIVSEPTSIAGIEINDGSFLKGKFRDVEVVLGELKTDENGRLLLLGGGGKSKVVDQDGNENVDENWIVSYANNDNWYDDISDGFVHVEVKLRSGEEIQVKESSWAIVGAPNYAPHTRNLVSLFDVMEEVAHTMKSDNGFIPSEFPSPSDPNIPSYREEILPILYPIFDLPWVNQIALRGHGFQKPGDIKKIIEGKLSDKADPKAVHIREKYFSYVREPIYTYFDAQGNRITRPIQQKNIDQACETYMPPLSGDEGDAEVGEPRKWLSYTNLQYARLKSWKEGRFTNDNSSEKTSYISSAPFDLTKTTLAQCVGGAFYPGIEMTSIARHPGLYKEAYRFDQNKIKPGDITKYMALPWQADFYACQDNWWPAQRPDDVVIDEDLKEIVAGFKNEASGDFLNLEAVLFKRKKWARGAENKAPSEKFISSKILPKVGAELKNYIDDRVKFYSDLVFSELPETDGECVPPWRIQFLVQEKLDFISDRYFKIYVKSPEGCEKLLMTREVKRALEELLGNGKATIQDLKASWVALSIRNEPLVKCISETYIKTLKEEISLNIRSVFLDHPDSKIKHADEFVDKVKADMEAGIDAPEIDIAYRSDYFYRMQFVQMMTKMSELYRKAIFSRSGYNGMVDFWKMLGFVKKKTYPNGSGSSDVIVEVGRSTFSGVSFREHFYYLMNIEKFPSYTGYAKELVEYFLKDAQKFIDSPVIDDETHPESYVPYSKANFEAKLEEIYEILRYEANNSRPWESETTRGETIQRILNRAPFNQTDGAWLRYIANSGPTNEIQGLLFDIWSDEIGNGDPSLHHGNIYTTLLNSLGFYLPEVSSKEYSEYRDIPESSYIGAVFSLAISLHSEEYFPELLGMTLFLEWEVLSLVPGIKRLDYLNINSHFYKMHVAIDNATEGHGYAAKRAVELYLDHIQAESGSKGVEENWRRIWRGFVAFALGGNGIHTSDQIPVGSLNAQDKIINLIERKKAYGNLNHFDKKLGGHKINDLFDNPRLFVKKLGNSSWVIPGDPESSPLISHLTSFNGPMYKVFDKKDMQLWRAWIIWLGEEGDTRWLKTFITKCDAMQLLLKELRGKAISAEAHARYSIYLPQGDGAKKAVSIAQLFRSESVVDLMAALKHPENGWVVPGFPEKSSLIVDFCKVNTSMGRILDSRFSNIDNRVGRSIIVEWIKAGCPLPGEDVCKDLEISEDNIDKTSRKKLIVKEYGPGAVH